MSAERGVRLVAAPRDHVHTVLLEPLAMPQWNPAFRAVVGPREPSVGVSYALRTVQGLSGSLRYDRISEDRIEMSWTVPGFTEHGSWELHDAVGGTWVAHAFTHSGPVAALLRPAYRGVAHLRLERLATRAVRRQGRVPDGR
jgi:hypothetical protein